MAHPLSCLPLEISLLAAVESPITKIVVLFSPAAVSSSVTAAITNSLIRLCSIVVCFFTRQRYEIMLTYGNNLGELTQFAT